ncbi:hypothetical protein [Candidatus Pelagibacter sp. HIMB1493]|mgnify:CR=1 FL=1|uniref:hypothetical protein n=1 Tax=Candidatus Pelagibacter sp. HIMB1493 TaxID=3413334 RepID=UPI003F85CFCB
MEKLTEAMSDKEMKSALKDLGFAVKKLAKNYDRLMDAQQLIMRLESDVYHEKWKVRYLTRRLKAINPMEAVTEEELQEMIKGNEN